MDVADPYLRESAAPAASRIEAPVGLPRRAGAFVKVQLSGVGALLPSWEKPIDVFFRYGDGQWRLAGVGRMPET